jgi:S-DNA-T family DNA segregation ATPase FtsK/SpoIIIE
MESANLARRTAGVLLIVGGFFLAASLLTFTSADVPDQVYGVEQAGVRNLCGPAGAMFAYHVTYWLGLAGHILVIALLGWGITLVSVRALAEPWLKLSGTLLLVVSGSSLAALVGGRVLVDQVVGNGGILGEFVASSLRQNVNPAGSFFVLLFAFGVGLILVNDRLVIQGARVTSRLAVDLLLRRERGRSRRGTLRITSGSTNAASAPSSSEAGGARAGRRRDEPLPTEEPEPTAAEEADVAAAPEPPPPPSNIPIRAARPLPAGERAEFQADLDAPAGVYELPAVSLLDEPQYAFTEEAEQRIRDNAVTLQETLREFDVQVRVVACDTGPVITQYEIELSPGTRVQKIFALANDISIALKSPPIRIVAPIPGKDTIGIEVPNQTKEVIRLRELLEYDQTRRRAYQIPLFLGKDASGEPLICDLTKSPHLLIAGRTGSGKSVCINTCILSILFTKTPGEVKLLLVDPKMVELSAFKRIPHLIAPVVTDMKKAAAVFQWAVTKMDERYDLLARAGVRDIAGYNRLGAEGIEERFGELPPEERSRVPEHMHYLVILVDEFADLMMIAGKDVEDAVIRLAQKARSVGIHIVLATQRPSADVITGLIKANLPSRIAFQVASKLESRIIVDQNGAETLLGQGDMLYLAPTGGDLIRAQGTYVGEEEVRRVVAFIKERANPEFSRELMQVRSEVETNSNRLKNYQDDLFEPAVRIVLEAQRGSVSLLQRRLGIGYGRAARLIDMMAEDGIVGDYQGSQARECLITLEKWDAEHPNSAGLPLPPEPADSVPAAEPEPAEAQEGT